MGQAMRVRWLGWAGAEIEHNGATVVIDPDRPIFRSLCTGEWADLVVAHAAR
jgi:hypothetical protein